MDSPHLSEREKAAVLWAEHVTKNTARSRDDVFEEVKKVFSEGEIVELTMMSGFFNFFNRLMDSLHIPLEDQSSVNKIKRGVQLDPEKVRSHLQTVLEHWPESFSQPPLEGSTGTIQPDSIDSGGQQRPVDQV